MIENDFLELSEVGKLPAEWSQVSKVEFRSISDFSGMLIGTSRPHFNLNKNGSKYLEIDFIDLKDNQNPGLILQASLFDLNSKNKIFEIGRTYPIVQFLSRAERNRIEVRGLVPKFRR